jgi:hypothetical protein
MTSSLKPLLVLAAEPAPAERLNHGLLLEGPQYPGHLTPIDRYGSLPLMLAGPGTGHRQQPLKTPADCDNCLKRLRRLPACNQQAVADLRAGMRAGGDGAARAGVQRPAHLQAPWRDRTTHRRSRSKPPLVSGQGLAAQGQREGAGTKPWVFMPPQPGPQG